MINQDELWENFQSRRFLHGHRETPKESFSIVFSALVPPAVPGEVHAQLTLIKHLAEYTTEKNWADKRLYIMQAVDRALSVPLPEIEGGDKGDAGMECQYSKDVGMPEHRCAVRCQYGRRQADLRIAAAIEACDWSGASIGNKEILKAAVHALRGGV